MVVTLPPEMLPTPDEGQQANVYVQNDDGSMRLVYCTDPIARINELERALRKIANREFNDIPAHMEGDVAAEIAELALSN